MELNESINLENLQNEFQARLGNLPIVRLEDFPFPESPDFLCPMMICQPVSLCEIIRVVRTASTMKLRVRGVGKRSAFTTQLYPDEAGCVLIDTSNLCDQKRIETISYRNAAFKTFSAVSILAGVTMDELCDFEIKNQIQVSGNIGSSAHTVVGAIVSGIHCVSNRHYGCLGDQVLHIRIVDSRGHLVEYSNFDEPIVNLGMLGIVYSVVLRTDPIQCMEVHHDFEKLEDIYRDFNSSKIHQLLVERESVRLLYFPMNSLHEIVKTNNNEEKCHEMLKHWRPKEDEIIVRSLILTKEDAQQRDFIEIIDPLLVESVDHVDVDQKFTPHFMVRRHHQEKVDKRFRIVQYQPWTSHSIANVAKDSAAAHRCSQFTVSFGLTGREEEFVRILQAIQNILHGFAIKDEFPLSLCIEVDFTPGSHCRLSPCFDEKLLPPKQNISLDDEPIKIPLGSDVVMADSGLFWYAHIRFNSLRRVDVSEHSLQWANACNQIYKTIVEINENAIPQWNSDWPLCQGITENLLHLHRDSLKQIKKILELVDRNGMFLNAGLHRLLDEIGAQALPYRDIYNKHRQNFLKNYQGNVKKHES